MFGLEKEKKPFQFDLEIELKKDQKKAKERITLIDHRIDTLKKDIQARASKKEVDECGVLLHGYTALKKVINNVVKS